jgi:hypothetical protein
VRATDVAHVNTRVADRDLGAKKLIEALTKHASVSVGIHEAEGSEQHQGTEMTIVDIAAVHEFGSEAAGIPQRSFIRDWFDETRTENEANLTKLGKAVVTGKLPSADVALEQFGLRAAGDVKKRIIDGINPELEDATIDRKGSSTPLVDKGQLLGSIMHKVDKA